MLWQNFRRRLSKFQHTFFGNHAANKKDHGCFFDRLCKRAVDTVACRVNLVGKGTVHIQPIQKAVFDIIAHADYC
mgnify:CR=1 FL=1